MLEIAVRDDVGTDYHAHHSEHAPQPGGMLTGRTFYLPDVPEGAGVLRITWMGETIEIAI